MLLLSTDKKKGCDQLSGKVSVSQFEDWVFDPRPPRDQRAFTTTAPTKSIIRLPRVAPHRNCLERNSQPRLQRFHFTGLLQKPGWTRGSLRRVTRATQKFADGSTVAKRLKNTGLVVSHQLNPALSMVCWQADSVL